MTTVGFVGLGAMGLPMAQNLVRAAVPGAAASTCGPRRSTRSRRPAGRAAATRRRGGDRRRRARPDGGQRRAGRERAVRRAARSTRCARRARRDPDGDLPAGRRGRARRAGRRRRAARFVDAPVSGGVVGATGGTLTIMAAAPQGRRSTAAQAGARGARRQGLPCRRDARARARRSRPSTSSCAASISPPAAEALALAEKAGIDGAIAAGDPGRARPPRAGC